MCHLKSGGISGRSQTLRELRESDLLLKSVSYVATNQDPTQTGRKADGLATLGAITGFWVTARLFNAVTTL